MTNAQVLARVKRMTFPLLMTMHDKHGDWTLAVRDEVALRRAALKVLRARVEQGYLEGADLSFASGFCARSEPFGESTQKCACHGVGTPSVLTPDNDGLTALAILFSRSDYEYESISFDKMEEA